MSNYWETPARFNPALAYQHQALLNFLLQMQARNSMLTGPQPSWHTPDLVSPQLLMQGLRPMIQPPRFVGPPIQFQPQPAQNPGVLGSPTQPPPMPPGGPSFPGLPTQIGPTLPNLPSMKGY